MKIEKKIILIAIVLLFAGASCAWAVSAEFKAIKEVEEREKKPAASEEAAAVERPQVKFAEEGLRDPFREPQIKIPEKPVPADEQPKVTQPPALTVQGLVWGGAFPQAIINRKVLKIGDTIEGARIANISKDGVVIFYQGSQFDLPAPAAGIREKKNLEGGLR